MNERVVGHALRGTGIQYDSARARAELLEQPREGEHVWTVIVTHVVSAKTIEELEAHEAHLDAETVAMVVTGCFICEQEYSKRLSFRRCPGEPK